MSDLNINITVTADEFVSEELLTKVKAVIARELLSLTGHVKMESKVALHVSTDLFYNAAVTSVLESSPFIEIK